MRYRQTSFSLLKRKLQQLLQESLPMDTAVPLRNRNSCSVYGGSEKMAR